MENYTMCETKRPSFKRSPGAVTLRKEGRGKTTAPHVNIKKSRELSNCTITGWKSPAVRAYSKELCLYSLYFTKASTYWRLNSKGFVLVKQLLYHLDVLLILFQLALLRKI
ncbi:probable G-protein coupled receptor 34 isoform X2 [Peromyscus californicus insignis]|uniref:probable G-protein coupled receptor 34 isoform X2 n=1 Tax=Peromyscus californicus insignis TaxID=564181 RepID=UPI0022A6B082|nr:probable G-protein coupled receptor 34 isoform X2 [Peromyscus californicus insignis]